MKSTWIGDSSNVDGEAITSWYGDWYKLFIVRTRFTRDALYAAPIVEPIGDKEGAKRWLKKCERGVWVMEVKMVISSPSSSAYHLRHGTVTARSLLEGVAVNVLFRLSAKTMWQRGKFSASPLLGIMMTLRYLASLFSLLFLPKIWPLDKGPTGRFSNKSSWVSREKRVVFPSCFVPSLGPGTLDPRNRFIGTALGVELLFTQLQTNLQLLCFLSL